MAGRDQIKYRNPMIRTKAKKNKIKCFQYFFQIINRNVFKGFVNHRNEVSGRLKIKIKINSKIIYKKHKLNCLITLDQAAVQVPVDLNRKDTQLIHFHSAI